MRVRSIGLYQPAWAEGAQRQHGHDEDVVTLAVAAGREAVGAIADTEVSRVIVVTPTPDVLEGFATAVVAAGIGLASGTPVELRVGGPTATLDALTASSSGTLIIGVDLGATAGAGAAYVAAEGLAVEPCGSIDGSLPMRVRHLGASDTDVYDDARVERERGWVPALDALGVNADSAPLLIVGPQAKDAKRLKATGTAPTRGASAPLFALADAEPGTRVLALDAGAAVLVEVGDGAAEVSREERPAQPVTGRPKHGADPVDIPFSLPAYDRAFEAKVRLLGGTCSCGTVDFPPRSYCSGCGQSGTQQLTDLPREGAVYTGVAVHVPVPGVPGPYAVAIVQLDGVAVRVLAHVTDTPAIDPPIDGRGRLVLRRVAVREGIPDYGYAWQPATDDAETLEVAR